MKKKKNYRSVVRGVAYVHCSFNNIVVTISDQQGNVIVVKSSGSLGFSGGKKSTPYAGQIVASKAVGVAKKDYGLKIVSAILKGPGPARDATLRALSAACVVISIEDRTPVPHNGCRMRRRRRV